MTVPFPLRSRLRVWGAAPIGLSRAGFGGGRWALLFMVALLVVLRLPAAWAHGRFLGEEGTVFFAYAWHRPALDALFRSFAGYLNLGANGTTLIAARAVRAGLLPLEGAPWLTMTMALAVQLLPAVLILTSDAAWLRRRWAMLAALLTLAVVPMAEEVFTNVLHIQFHLALGAALILAFDVPASPRMRAAYAALLFVAPLCGPGAIVLLPFLVLRGVVERDRGRAVQAAVFVLGAAAQLLLFVTPSPVRGQLLDPTTLAAIGFVRLVALPFGGRWLAGAIGTGVYDARAAGGIGWWAAAVAAIACLALLVGAALARRRDPAIWLIAPGLALAAVSFGGGMIATDASEWFNVGTAERYNFLPLVLVTLGLIALAERRSGRSSRLCRWLVLATLAWGVIGYPFAIVAIDGAPEWRDEVAAWSRDHHHPLETWPRQWTMDLSDEDRPCSAPRPPTYCERAWEERVAGQAAGLRAGVR